MLKNNSLQNRVKHIVRLATFGLFAILLVFHVIQWGFQWILLFLALLIQAVLSGLCYDDTGSYRNVTIQFWYPEKQQEDETYPLLLFSHGSFGFRGSNYSTFMELASHGYELESGYEESRFFRCSKSVIVNLMKVHSIKPALNGRFLAKLANGESVIISRQYVPPLKERLKGC
ncbi:MAG: LytTR family transcriptional regulator DNA-binding domain-containing protein [Desulfitobacterium sp.]